MATTPVGALPDISKANFYGQSDADQQKLLDSLELSQKSLEQRYENPNWFNVAAGFFKPQLGGFTASLGSASQALGENLEKQRANELTVAQQRAQVALMKNQLGQRSAANKLVEEHKGPVTEELLKQVIARAGPDSQVAQGIKAQLEGERASQTLLAQQQSLRQAQGTQALQVAQQQFNSGAISREEYQRQLEAIKATYGPTQPVTPARPVGAPGTTLTSEAVPVTSAPAAVSPARPDLPVVAIPPQGAAPKPSVAAAPAGTPARVPPMGEWLTNNPGKNENDYREAMKARKETPFAVQPPATDGAKQEKIVINSPLSTNEQGLDPEAVRAQVAINETSAKAKYDSLEKAAGPTIYKSARSVIDDQMALIKANTELAKQVTAILSKGDFASQVGTMLEKGVGVSLGGISGQIHLPVKAIKEAGFNDKQRVLAQTMANNYAKIAIYQQKLNSVNPNAASNAEAGLYNGVVPTMDITPNAALRALGHLRIDLDATNAQYKFLNDVYRGQHPNVSLARGVQDRYSAIQSHPSFYAVYDPYADEHKQLSAAFQRLLDTKKP